MINSCVRITQMRVPAKITGSSALRNRRTNIGHACICGIRAGISCCCDSIEKMIALLVYAYICLLAPIGQFYAHAVDNGHPLKLLLLEAGFAGDIVDRWLLTSNIAIRYCRLFFCRSDSHNYNIYRRVYNGVCLTNLSDLILRPASTADASIAVRTSLQRNWPVRLWLLWLLWLLCIIADPFSRYN